MHHFCSNNQVPSGTIPEAQYSTSGILENTNNDGGDSGIDDLLPHLDDATRRAVLAYARRTADLRYR